MFGLGQAPSLGIEIWFGVLEFFGKANSVTVFLLDDCRSLSITRLPTRPTVGVVMVCAARRHGREQSVSAWAPRGSARRVEGLANGEGREGGAWVRAGGHADSAVGFRISTSEVGDTCSSL